jgi:ankyrin repeat protein
MKKHFEIEKYLIEKGAKNDYGWIFYHEFPLNVTVINDQIDGLHFLIKKQGLEWFKAEIKRIRNENGENVMHFSARNTGDHRLEVVDLLVQHGGQIDIKSHENGDTPLHIAVKKFNIKLVEHICTKYKNAALNSINDYAQSPLFCVPTDSTIFDDPNEFASTLSPIIYVKPTVDKNDLPIQIKMLDALLNAGFDFNQKDYRGNTLLHKAAICNDLKLLSYLIENADKYKLKINLANNFRQDYANLISESFKGKSKDSKDVRDAIFVFARRGHLRGLQALTTNQNVNGINSKGYSALHYAVLCGSFEIVQYLLDKRNACTDLVAKSTSLKRDVTPLDIAIHCEEKNNGQPICENYAKIREILIAKGAKKAEDIKNSLPQSAVL